MTCGHRGKEAAVRVSSTDDVETINDWVLKFQERCVRIGNFCKALFMYISFHVLTSVFIYTFAHHS